MTNLSGIYDFQEFNNLNILDLSQNNISNLSGKSFTNITYLDLSNTNFLETKWNLSCFLNLKFVNISKTNLNLSSLSFSKDDIQSLDLSFNNLQNLNREIFKKLGNLKIFYLKATNINDFRILNDLRSIEEIEISQNLGFSDSIYYITQFRNLTTLKISNITNGSNSKIAYFIERIPRFMSQNLEYLDVSYNNLSNFNGNYQNMVSIDLSYNNIDLLQNEADFLNFYPKLKKFILKNGLSRDSSKYVFNFNKMLETAVFTGNKLEKFPKFCQIYKSCLRFPCDRSAINLECKLRILYFDSNNLKSLENSFFSNLYNLEYLNLEDNKIEFTENNVFINLFRLETLILSQNSLKQFENSEIFNSLVNLKSIYLKNNYFEIIPSNLFHNLLKLKIIDLSKNKIKILKQLSFVNLLYLRDLYLSENDFQLKIEHNSTFDITTIQNIYVSKTILDDSSNRIFFIDLFKFKNRFPNKRYNRSFFYF